MADVRETASSPEAASTGADGRRRRLLKGAIALPSVLTLASGAQAAQASITCLAAQNAGADGGPQRFITADARTGDGWLRQRVAYGKSGDTEVFCTPGGDVRGMGGSMYSSCVDYQGNANLAVRWVDGAGNPVAGTITPVDQTAYENSPRYGLVYVDREGTVMTLDNSGYANQIVSGSCWNSISTRV